MSEQGHHLSPYPISFRANHTVNYVEPRADEPEPDDFDREGGSWARCGACGITFASVTGFDDHRIGSHEKSSRHCRTETEIRARGYEPNQNGHWRKPSDKEWWNK